MQHMITYIGLGLSFSLSLLALVRSVNLARRVSRCETHLPGTYHRIRGER